MDKELEIMLRMKAEGKSDDEVGYAITKSIYGESPSVIDLQMFSAALAHLMRETPEDKYLIGSARALKEILTAQGY